MFVAVSPNGLRVTQHNAVSSTSTGGGGASEVVPTITTMPIPFREPRTGSTSDPALPLSMWHTPVRAVAVAGDTPIVALVIGLPEGAPSVAPADTTFPAGPPADSGSRHVYLFDATTDTYLAELYFRGAVVHTLHANSRLLMVGMVDALHLIDLTNLQHLRQQSMFKPLNCRGLLALSQSPTPSSGWGRVEVYRVAYPHSTRRKGEVCVLTVRLPTVDVSAQQEHVPEAGAVGVPSSAAVAAASDDVESGVGSNSASASLPNRVPSAFPGGHTEVVQSALMVPAHHRPVAALCLSNDGRYLATASELGCTVNLFDADGGGLLKAFQRGHQPAFIYGLALSSASTMLAALSSAGTLHLFDCENAIRAGTSANPLLSDKPRAVLKKHTKPLELSAASPQRVRPPSLPSTSDGTPRPAVVLPHPDDGNAYHIRFSPDGCRVWVGQSHHQKGQHRCSVQRFEVFLGMHKLNTLAAPEETFEMDL